MAIAYSNLWAVTDNNEAVKYTHNSNCWGDLYYSHKWKGYKTPHLSVWVRLPKGEISVKQANWYWLNFIRPSIPDRVVEKNCINARRIFSKTYIRECFALTSYEVPWIKVNIDLSQITSNDLSVFLTLLRTPYEFPNQVTKAHQVYLLGVPLNPAIFIGLMSEAEHTSHSLYAAIYQPNTITKELLNKFDYKQIWEEMPPGKDSWAVNPYKTSYIQVSMFTRGWMKGHNQKQNPDVYNNSSDWMNFYKCSKYGNITITKKQEELIDLYLGDK